LRRGRIGTPGPREGLPVFASGISAGQLQKNHFITAGLTIYTPASTNLSCLSWQPPQPTKKPAYAGWRCRGGGITCR
jgi:hypothetical protein